MSWSERSNRSSPQSQLVRDRIGAFHVYGFVKQSDGHVRIYSELGHGTTFKLYLPHLRGGVGEEAQNNASVAIATLPAEPGETVLVVDDEPPSAC